MNAREINSAHGEEVCSFRALENIKRRCRERKKGKNASSLRTALVLQGGAMRGVFGAGACCALEELGYTEGFDHVYGVSAGALNGAYFLSGQAAYGTTIYYQNINNTRFINLFRFQKMVNIDFLVNIITQQKPLNVGKLLNSPTSLNIVATKVSTGESVLFNSKDPGIDIIKALKATAAIPFAYDVPVRIEDEYYLDGGVSCPIPITEAIDAGCTDILVILTRPEDYIPRPPGGILAPFLIAPKIKQHGERFFAAYRRRHKVHAEKLDIIKGRKKHPREGVNIIALFPSPSLGIKRITKRTDILKNTAVQGAVKTLQLFGIKDYQPTEVLKFLNY